MVLEVLVIFVIYKIFKLFVKYRIFLHSFNVHLDNVNMHFLKGYLIVSGI